MSSKRDLEDPGSGQPRTRRALVAPEAQREASPVTAQSSSGETDEMSVDTTNQDPPSTVEELEEEIESLEAVVDRLDAEKHALKMRLNQVDNIKRFNPGDCKKWLANNFDFDRKDTPELLASIFENYLLQNDTLEPLPHQLIVKNSVRGQARRDKIAIERFNKYQRREKDKIPVTDAKSRKAPRASSQNGAPSDVGTYGQFLYISPDALDDLYATEPWSLFLQHWPKLRPGTGKATNFGSLVRLQDEFLRSNVVAIWERTHWIPIKMENGKTAKETKLLGLHYSRRKRRQALLKERLESLAVELKPQYEKTLFEQSIFGNRWVAAIMQRPSLWIPCENEPLLEQLHILDAAEPDRNFHFGG